MEQENGMIPVDSDDDSEGDEDLVEEDYPDPDPPSGEESGGENADQADPDPAPNSFNDHSYLGEMEEVRGRTIFDEDTIFELPVLVQESLVCVPGQTVPLNISHPHMMTMMRNVIDGNHTFGILSFRPLEPYIQNVKFKIGTTAEVFEYSQPPEGVAMFGVGLRIKATIRQRFKVLSARTQIDGIVMARIQVLPENVLHDSLYECRSLSLDRWRMLPAHEKNSPADSLLSKERLYSKQYHIPCSAWPSWVHRSYDLHLVAHRVRNELQKSIIVSVKKGINVPKDPIDLSYWVIQNLPLEDEQRLKLLNINNPCQRLRAELSILQRCEYLCCRECEYPIAKQADVFCLSKDGPHGVYVNPFGHVHETLTVHQVDGIRIVSPPSTEFSWFPGYAWSIIQCTYCQNHMGWRFTATNRQVKPKKFWGLCRTSLKPKLKKDDDGQTFDLIT